MKAVLMVFIIYIVVRLFGTFLIGVSLNFIHVMNDQNICDIFLFSLFITFIFIFIYILSL